MLVVLLIVGLAPEVICFPMKCVDVSVVAVVLSLPGGWMMKLLFVRVLRMLVVVLLHSVGVVEAERWSST